MWKGLCCDLVADTDREVQLLPEQYVEISAGSEMANYLTDDLTSDLIQKDKVQTNDADLSEWTCVGSEVIKIYQY